MIDFHQTGHNSRYGWCKYAVSIFKHAPENKFSDGLNRISKLFRKKHFFQEITFFEKKVVDHFWGVIIDFKLENMSQ